MKKLLVIILILFISGCTTCRYSALRNAAWAYEEGYDVQYVVYTTSPIFSLGVFNAHAQATFLENGKRQWISSEFMVVSGWPDYPMGEYCWIMTLNQYVDWLKNNKRLSVMPMPPKEIRDKYWPKTKEVMK